MTGNAISDAIIHINAGDDIYSRTMVGTIYSTPRGMAHTFYLNPVYQSADGSVYVVSGGGMQNSYVESEGSAMSQTLEAVSTVNENGKSRTDSFSITVSINVMFALEKIVILQMSADNKLVSRTEFKPDAMPETFMPDMDTEYLIVEIHKNDGAGGLVISRDIYDKDAGTIETSYAGDDGICVKRTTSVSGGRFS